MRRGLCGWLILSAFLVPAYGQISGVGEADAVSRLNGPRGESIIGNGVDSATGNFSLDATPVSFQGGRSVDFTLFYDSLLPVPGAPGSSLGPGWTHRFEARLNFGLAGPVVYWDNNRKNLFSGTDGSYRGGDESARYARLEQSGNDWLVTAQSGTVYRFDADGLLKSISNKARQTLSVRRDSFARIVAVVEEISNKEIGLHYAANGSTRLQYITDPANRVSYFGYDQSGYLRAIHLPVDFGDEAGNAFAPVDIPDAAGNSNPGRLVKSVFANTSGQGGLVRLISTQFEHLRPSDVRVLLVSPSGTQVEITQLASVPSPSVRDFDGVILDDFQGEQFSGAWQLILIDSQPGSTGRLNGFWLEFSGPTDPTYFTYDAAGRLSGAVDADGGQFFANTYDALGRVASQDDGVSTNMPSRFVYEDAGGGRQLTRYFDRTGAEHLFEHDSRYRLLSRSDPLGHTTDYRYNSLGDRTAITDPLGNTTEFSYDPNGNVDTVADAMPTPNVTTMTYDSDNNVRTITDAAGNTSSFSWQSGNLTRVRDAEGNTDNKTYGGTGQLVGNLMADGGGIDYGYQNGLPVSARRRDASGSKTERSQYDDLGRQTRITNAEGKSTDLEYDNRGNLIRSTDPLGHTEEMHYDVRGRMVSKIDPNGNVTTIAYDGNGNMLSRTDALGNVTRFVYDGEDRLVQTTDPQGNVTSASYDAAGRLVTQTDGEGNTIRKEYDANGNEIAVYDPEDVKLIETVYDERNLPVVTIDAFGNRTTTTYNGIGLPSKMEDAAGNVTTFEYDSLGRLVKVTDPLGRELGQEYLSDDVLAEIIDAAGHSTSFSYDLANRIRRVEPYSGRRHSVAYDYDERYLLQQAQLPDSVVWTYAYDDAGRLIKESATGTNYLDPDTSYEYDNNGNLTRVNAKAFSDITPRTRLTRGYDNLNRVTSFTDSSGATIRYGYDAAGNLARLTYPDGRLVRYSYDGANRMSEVRDWAGRVTQFDYDSNSRITRIAFPNGTVRLMDYDAGGRIIRRRDLGSASQVIVDYTYTYDKLGQVRMETGQPANQPFSAQRASMTYDNVNRLTTYNGSPVSFDGRGNMTMGPLGGASVNFNYDARNRLRAAGQTDFFYDEEDRLTGYHQAGAFTQFVVDPHADLSRILTKTAPGGEVTYYVYGPGLLYEETNGNIRTYHYDHRGSTIAFANSSGSVVGTVAYGPWGEIASRGGETNSPFLFGGLWGIVTTPDELYNMRFRWYSPEIKRFLNQDAHFGTITEPGTLNRYSYAGANPLNYNDPNGQFLNVLIGATVGAIVNVTATVISKAINNEPISAGDLIGAAVGGAVTGGLIGACGPVCAAAGPVAIGILSGAAGGAVGNATGQLIDLAIAKRPISEFSWEDFGLETSTSAIFGAIPLGGKGGRAAVGAVAKKGGSKAAGPAGILPIAAPILSPKQAAKTNLRVLGQRIMGNAALYRKGVSQALFSGSTVADVLLATGQNQFTWGIKAADEKAASSASVSEALFEVIIESLENVNRGRKGTYGEFGHWRLYTTATELAGKPLPDNPNNLLTAF